jgi:hypothetical protein
MEELHRAVVLVKGHLTQIHDVQYHFTMQKTPKVDSVPIPTEAVDFAWHRDGGWEKRTTSREDPKSGAKLASTIAWDGRCAQRQDIAPPPSKASRGTEGSSRPYLESFEPLSFLHLRGWGPHDQSFALDDWLMTGDVRLEGREPIGGRDTLVVSINVTYPARTRAEGVVLKYWLDEARGGLPLREEIYEKGSLRTRLDVTLAKVAPGIFLPTGYVMESFATPERKRTSTTTVRIDPSSIKLNQGLTQEFFRLNFEDGMLVENTDQHTFRYAGKLTEPGGPKINPAEVDRAADSAIAARDADARPAPRNGTFTDAPQGGAGVPNDPSTPGAGLTPGAGPPAMGGRWPAVRLVLAVAGVLVALAIWMWAAARRRRPL